MKTKILTKFQVYVSRSSHSTAISSIWHFYSVLNVKSSFCKHCPSKKVHSFKSCDDKAMKFCQNASNMSNWKIKKICHQKLINQGSINEGDTIGGRAIGRVKKSRVNVHFVNLDNFIIEVHFGDVRPKFKAMLRKWNIYVCFYCFTQNKISRAVAPQKTKIAKENSQSCQKYISHWMNKMLTVEYVYLHWWLRFR